MELALSSARIGICVPSLGTWEDEFSFHLQKMIVFSSQKPFPGYAQARHVGLKKKTGSLMPLIRESFFDELVAEKYTHAMLIDSDQTFPHDTIHRLIAHQKPIVAANVATKEFPSRPTARKKNGTPFGAPVFSSPKKVGLEQVWRIGCAVMLIDLSILKKLGRGLFEVVWHPDINQYRGEDWSFCQKCEEADVPIYIDHDLSRQVGHIGRYKFTFRDIPEFLEVMAAAA